MLLSAPQEEKVTAASAARARWRRRMLMDEKARHRLRRVNPAVAGQISRSLLQARGGGRFAEIGEGKLHFQGGFAFQSTGL